MTKKALELPPAKTMLNQKQRQFIENWKKAGFTKESKVQAYLDAGYSNASNITTTMKQPALIKIVRQAMEKHGVTVDKLVEKHAELLDAVKFTPDGRAVEPDNNVQLRAMQEGYKLYNVYPAQKMKVDVRREEDVRITLDDQRQAERILQECVDAEIVEDVDGDGSSHQLEEAPDRPL